MFQRIQEEEIAFAKTQSEEGAWCIRRKNWRPGWLGSKAVQGNARRRVGLLYAGAHGSDMEFGLYLKLNRSHI